MASKQARPKWRTKLVHPSYSIEQCPKCRFPEADGGYCNECDFVFSNLIIPTRTRTRRMA